MKGSGLVKMTLAAGAGAATAYLFDPARGRRRRSELRDRGRATIRREWRSVERQAHYERGRVEGIAHKLRQSSPRAPEDDATLVDKIRSEVLGRIVAGPHITLDAVAGVVTLRGQIADQDRALDIEGQVRQVPGVVDVVNLLHIPGMPAPNKVDALRAGNGR